MSNSTLVTIDNANSLVLLVQQPLDQNPAAVYLAGLSSERSRVVQKQALSVIAEMLTGDPDVLAVNWAALRFQHTAAIRSRLIERYKPAGVNRMLSALRGVLKAAWRLNQMPIDAYQRAADVEGVKGSTIPSGRELSGGELGALMGACEADPSHAGVRDGAIIAVAYTCGLRRAELVGIDLEDYDPPSGCLVVRGKGRKERTVYLMSDASQAVDDWLAIRGREPGALFWPINRGGNLFARRMSTQAVYNMLAKRGEEAGIRDFSPHDLRRTFVSDLLEAGADIATVAKMAGHANVQTTARYDRRPEQAKVKAAGLLHIPYRGRRRSSR